MYRSMHTILTVLGAMALVTGAGGAQGKSGSLRLPVRADSRLWLEGISNVRNWTCKATSLEALIAIDARSADSRDNVADFGIVPPGPWFGVLRTGDKVLVQFEIFVSPQAVASAQREATVQGQTRAPEAPPR